PGTCPRARGESAGQSRIGRPPSVLDPRRCPLIRSLFTPSGAVAQLGARVNGIHEVTGSIPVSSTNSGNNLGTTQRGPDARPESRDSRVCDAVRSLRNEQGQEATIGPVLCARPRCAG